MAAVGIVHMMIAEARSRHQNKLPQGNRHMDLQAHRLCCSAAARDTQRDCTVAGTDSDCSQHMLRDCSHQTAAAAAEVVVEVVVSNSAGCMPAAEAIQHMILQKWYYEATDTRPGRHIRSTAAAPLPLPLPDNGCCMSPGPGIHTAVAAAALLP